MTTPRTRPRRDSSLRGVVVSGAGFAELPMLGPPVVLVFCCCRAPPGTRTSMPLHTGETSTPPSMSGSQLGKPLSVLRRTHPDLLAKVMSQRGRRPEAAALRDEIDWKRGVFEQFPRGIDPRPRDPVRRAHSGRRPKPAHEGAFAHGRQACQLGDVPALAGPFPDFIEQHRKRLALFRAASAILDGSFQKLRLAPLTMRRNDQPARHLIRYLGTIVASNQMQAEIESRGAPGGGENAAL